MKPTCGPNLTVGFAGSRRLFADGLKLSFQTEASIGQAVEDHLVRVLKNLPERLGLPWDRPVVGVSQIAIGADLHFTRACSSLGLSQRILLPQPASDYFAAKDLDGTPDFNSAQRVQALGLLREPNIKEVCVVGNSVDRGTRFIETNRAIVAASDVILCLLRHDAKGKPGGTLDLMDLARQAGKPVFEIRLSRVGENPVFRDTLHRFPLF